MLPPKHILSKTTFLYGCQCHKRLWLHKNKPKLKDEISVRQAAIFQQGTDVGLLAQKLFPGGVDASPPQPWLYQQSVQDTQQYLRQGHQVIYEAAFQYEGMMCAVDLLVKTTKGWIAYEVKSSLSLRREHIQDAALQYYVITNSGLDLADMVVVHLNKSYIRAGALNLKKLFKPVTVLPNVKVMQERIGVRTAEFKQVLSVNQVPNVEVGAQCLSPYPCDFLGFCNEGFFAGMEEKEVIAKSVFVSVENLALPLFFLQIDSWRNAVPLRNGDWPYRAVPFQFTVNKIYAEGLNTMEHFFAADKTADSDSFIYALKTSLSQEGAIVVCNKKAHYYLLEDLKKDLPAETNFLSSLQERLLDINTEEERTTESLQEILDEKELYNISISSAYEASALFFNLTAETELEGSLAVLETLKNYGEGIVKAMQSLVFRK